MNDQMTTTSPDKLKAVSAFSNPTTFEQAQRMAKALGSSTLVPKEYQGNIANVLIAMEVAHRVGTSPFMVMQQLDIIHGRPSWRATFLIATVNACGRFTSLRFRYQGEPGTDAWGCRAVAKDRETGEECVGALITINLAKQEGWTSKSGSKWKTMPEQMLMYRAAAFWTRIYAPELSLGLNTSDEVEDIHASIGAPVTAPSATNLRALEAELLGEPTPAAPPSDPKPEVDPETGEIVPPEVGR